MTTAISFTPQHQQPFTLEQAVLLEVDMLVAEISRLQNSISHLERTQAELRSFIQEDPEADDDGELDKAVQENDVTISSQRERISLIKVALLNKVGEGGMRHMGLNEEPQGGDSTGRPTPLPAELSTEGQAAAEDEGGLHL